MAMAEPSVRTGRPARGKRRGKAPGIEAPGMSEAAERRELSALLDATRREGAELSAILKRLEERFL